ncbi:hypothetical protein K432DRAFT_89080 [Lepidopterella palustris CBS 459.81]|uniref:Secreted protein n=1 Tax=Lepidopterella palustris CBS 459.81 TaxID=1314670 RepID=A0A8E2J7Q6_9PEZI|nr:hypothetical protein K432DRAFT_89080 [Lepidopterella palustris CBS 459.81]
MRLVLGLVLSLVWARVLTAVRNLKQHDTRTCSYNRITPTAREIIYRNSLTSLLFLDFQASNAYLRQPMRES